MDIEIRSLIVGSFFVAFVCHFVGNEVSIDPLDEYDPGQLWRRFE
jgi:hypothetical protein